MQPIIMQDWITVRGTGTTTSVVMSQPDWILTAPFQDITFYMEVRNITGTPVINYQTAPAKDDYLFQNLGAAAGITMVAGVTVSPFTLSGATIPVSHWTRWRLTATAGAPWDVTFRVMASANAIG
jgi:hypothetical protein